jgi:hypothetical protein
MERKTAGGFANHASFCKGCASFFALHRAPTEGMHFDTISPK